MSRQHKYRAWDENNKKMTSWEELCEWPEFNERPNHHLPSLLNCELSDWSPEQFIGHQDIHKVDIYHGDILSVLDPNSEVCPNLLVEENENAGACIIEISSYDYDVTTIGWAMDLGFIFAVIGNIHLNPDLIEANP